MFWESGGYFFGNIQAKYFTIEYLQRFGGFKNGSGLNLAIKSKMSRTNFFSERVFFINFTLFLYKCKNNPVICQVWGNNTQMTLFNRGFGNTGSYLTTSCLLEVQLVPQSLPVEGPGSRSCTCSSEWKLKVQPKNTQNGNTSVKYNFDIKFPIAATRIAWLNSSK